jgi:hypothetical protein
MHDVAHTLLDRTDQRNVKLMRRAVMEYYYALVLLEVILSLSLSDIFLLNCKFNLRNLGF